MTQLMTEMVIPSLSLSLLLSFPNTNVHVSVNVSSLSLSFDRLHKHNCMHARMHTELQIGQLLPSLVNNKQVSVCVLHIHT